jgi:IS30 family transposase
MDVRASQNLPVGGQRVVFDRMKVRELRAEKKSIRAIAKLLGVSVGTVANTLAADVQRTRVKVGAAQGTFSGVIEANAAVQ